MVGLSMRVFNQTLLKLRLAHTQKVLRFRFKADYDIIIVRKKDRIEAQLMIIIYAQLCVCVLPSPLPPSFVLPSFCSACMANL